MGFDQKTITTVFISVWIVLFIAGLIFHLTAPPLLKRKLQPFIAVGVGTTFLCFVGLISGRAGFYFAAIPVALITYLNVKAVKYCPRCGAMSMSPFMFPAPKFCVKCGTKLDDAQGR